MSDNDRHHNRDAELSWIALFFATLLVVVLVVSMAARVSI